MEKDDKRGCSSRQRETEVDKRSVGKAEIKPESTE